MPRIQMTHYLYGTIGGVVSPKPGDYIEVDSITARALTHSGHAKIVEQFTEEEVAVADDPEEETAAAPKPPAKRAAKKTARKTAAKAE